MEKDQNMSSSEELAIAIHNIKYVKLFTGEYCITQLLGDLEWLVQTIHFTKSFSDYLVYLNKTSNEGFNTVKPRYSQGCPLETNHDTEIAITDTLPFLRFKDTLKSKYKIIVCVLKHIYKTAFNLPDADRVIHTLKHEFHIDNNVFLKHPDFIIDHFIYHTYSHNHISENYEKVLNHIKAYEYLYHKTFNYLSELEFDLENIECLDKCIKLPIK